MQLNPTMTVRALKLKVSFFLGFFKLELRSSGPKEAKRLLSI